MQRRIRNSAIIGLTLIVLLSGCGQAKTPAQGSASQTQTPATQPTPTPAPTPAVSESKQMKIKVYYGDENAEKLVEQEASITYKEDSGKYAAALKSLTASPDSKNLALLKGFTFNSVALKNGALTVDVSMAPESRLGSGGEAMLLEAMKKTVFQFSEIQSLDILLDGKAVDSLMGHMDLPHPMKRG